VCPARPACARLLEDEEVIRLAELRHHGADPKVSRQIDVVVMDRAGGEIRFHAFPGQDALCLHDARAQNEAVQLRHAEDDVGRQPAGVSHQAEIRFEKAHAVVSSGRAQFVRRPLPFLPVATDDEDLGAMVGQLARDGLADAIRAPGHQRGFMSGLHDRYTVLSSRIACERLR
jgi:hypothetical protein